MQLTASGMIVLLIVTRLLLFVAMNLIDLIMFVKLKLWFILWAPILGNDSGKFVSGAISWLLRTALRSWVIVSLDLGNETSQELLLPNYGGADVLTLGVLRDCLCI